MAVVQQEQIAERARVHVRPLDPRLSGQQRLDLDRVITIIGSGEGCDVQLPPGLTDGPHAAIILLGNTAYLCDLGAPGGTTLNQRRIRWARLADGDEVVVGTVRMQVGLEEIAELATGEQPSFRLGDEATIGQVTTIDPVLVVGSDPGCDVVLYDDAVAARHCLIAWTQEGPLLRQLSSGHEVYLNDSRVTLARLVGGDGVTVGPYRLRFEVDVGSDELGDTAAGSSGNGRSEPVCAPGAPFGGEDQRDIVAGCLPWGKGLSWERLWAERVDRAADRLVAGVIANIGGDRAAKRDRGSDSARPPQTGGSGAGLGAEKREHGEAAADGDLGIGRIDAGTPPFAGEGGAMSRAPLQSGDAIEAQIEGELSNAERHRTAGVDEVRVSDEGLLRMKARVAAAQRALDDRASKHLERLNQERVRLQSFEAELERKAAELLEVARENRRVMNRGREAIRGEMPPAESADFDVPCESSLRGAAVDRTETHDDGATATDGAEAAFDRSWEGRQPRSLQEHAAELAELVRSEQDELDLAESRFASLRLGIKRLRQFVERAGSRHQQQTTELDSRARSLKGEEAALAREREVLADRIREIDVRSARNRLQLEQTAREREESDREAEQLAHARRKLVEKEDALRSGLQLERQRIQIRHTELRRKEADLARAARERRRTIEAEISRRRAALEMREAEIRAHRAAIEEAGRAELDKAAAELERVLNMRLADLEAEMSGSGGSAPSDNALPASAAGLRNGQGVESLSEDDEAFAGMDSRQAASLANMLRETVAGRAKRLTAVQDELSALRDAIVRLGQDTGSNEESSTAHDQQAEYGPARAFRRSLRRSPNDLRQEFQGRDSVLRAGAEGVEATGLAAGESPTATAVGSQGSEDPGEALTDKPA